MTEKIELKWADLDPKDIEQTQWTVENVVWDLVHLAPDLKTKEVTEIVRYLGEACEVLDQLTDLVRHENSPKRPAQAPFKVEIPASA